jgi:ATP-binding cassette subfamily B protein
MMFSINVAMTFLSLATIPACMIILALIMRRSRKYFAKQWEITGDLNGHIEEMYTGHNIVKAFGREEKSISDFREMNENLYKTGRKAQFLSGVIFPLMGFVNNIGYVLICVAGGIFAIDGKIKIGDIQAMIQYSRNLTQQVNQSSQIINTIQSALASAERVFALLDEPEQIPETITEALAPVNNEVTFEGVEFYYSEDKPLIGSMNLKVKPGQMVAIVGPTGAGKTTLVNLLMRFYDVADGAIKVNGVDIRNVARADLRNIFGMVLQDTWLFSGTIYDNIAYGRENSAKEDIYAAAKAARADHFIDTLPEGYDTILDEEGSNISQGQRQLLTIARAINANHEILILDEATSSVDTRTEILIQKAMSVLMKGKTSFVIAHRLSTIKDADTILVMNNGDIIEQGSHAGLLEKGGFYSELYYSQFAK